MTFEDYLISKKIDLPAFQAAEPLLYGSWKGEFEQMHPNSFTMQKFHLINPVRRKYTLKQEIKVKAEMTSISEVKSAHEIAKENPQDSTSSENRPDDKSSSETKPVIAKPARPVFKPKPKIN